MGGLRLLESNGKTALSRLLDTLGVVFTTQSLAQAFASGERRMDLGDTVILSSEELTRGVREHSADVVAGFLRRHRRVLLYPFQSTADALAAIRQCIGVIAEATSTGTAGRLRYTVPADSPVQSPFAGLDIVVADPAADTALTVRESPYPSARLVSVDDGGLATWIQRPGSDVFIVSSTAVFDVDDERTRNLDCQQCFSGLVPLLLFLHHSDVPFWRTTVPAANLIIDDLPLRPRYGFVNIRTLAHSVRELGCAVSMAFIPWNCDRTSKDAVEVLRTHWPGLSLSIHGCDHVGAEFATQSVADSLPLVATSLERMRALSVRTGLPHDKVMVFPQGRFSQRAMEGLRQSEFMAAVNTELLDHSTQRGVRAGELLAPAIMSYAGFPLFLRRKMSEPLANFALDLLLGKPCLIVTHHDDFQGGMEPFAALIRSLNRLEPGLRWTNLESIVTRSYSTRRSGDGIDVQLFSPTSTVSASPGAEVRCSKAEPLLDREFEVEVGDEHVKACREGADLSFRCVLPAEPPTTVRIRVSQPDPVSRPARPIRYRAKVATRRYLSEFRDNYVARSPWATAAVKLIRRPHVPVTSR
jgi:hypothetical protein